MFGGKKVQEAEPAASLQERLGIKEDSKEDVKKAENKNINYDITVSECSAINGNIKSEGCVRIDGTVNGEIEVEGDVMVSPGARVNGDIKCRNIEIRGSVMGNIMGAGALQISKTGSLDGDISVKSFNIDPGANFGGNCKINSAVDVFTSKARGVNPAAKLGEATLASLGDSENVSEDAVEEKMAQA